MDGIEILIILFFVLISILDAVGRSRRKRQAERGAKGQGAGPRRPDAPAGAEAPDRARTEPHEGFPAPADATRVETADRTGEPSTSEGLIPRDIWEEIAGLVLDGQPARRGSPPDRPAGTTSLPGPLRDLPGPGDERLDVEPYHRPEPEPAASQDWRSWTLEEASREDASRGAGGVGLPERVEEEWRSETRKARFPVPPSGAAGLPTPRPRWQLSAAREAAPPAPPAGPDAAAAPGAAPGPPGVGAAPWPDPRRLLRSGVPAALRQAFILKEVLGPPRALREHGE